MKQKPALLNGICTWAATRFFQRIHRITHRMPLRIRPIERQKVLVIAPHPDDEVIGAGGSLALHQQAGSDVVVAFLTPESREAGVPTSRIRQEEARRVGASLGFRCRFLGYPDGQLSLHEREIAEDLADLLREFAPDAVITPFVSDHHRDHQAAAHALSLAIGASGFRGEVWCCELWSTLWPNVAIDIGNVADHKRDTINLYESQVAGLPYAETALALNRYRGMRARLPYAECFYVCSAQQFIDLSKTLTSI